MLVPIIRALARLQALTAVSMKSIILRDMTLCSRVEVRLRLGESYSLNLRGRGQKVNQLSSQREGGMQRFAYSSMLNVEAICCSETSVNFCWTT
jgi:hypothetical protein